MTKKQMMQRKGTMRVDTDKRSLLGRQSTIKVKFEDYTESQISSNHRKSYSGLIPKTAKLSKIQLKEIEFRVSIKVKIY